MLKERTRFLKAEETHKCDAALTFSMGDSIKPEFRGDSRNISLSAVSPCLERISRTCWFYLAAAHIQRPFPEIHRVNIMPITFLSTGCVDIFALYTLKLWSQHPRPEFLGQDVLLGISCHSDRPLLWIILIWPDCGSHKTVYFCFHQNVAINSWRCTNTVTLSWQMLLASASASGKIHKWSTKMTVK